MSDNRQNGCSQLKKNSLFLSTIFVILNAVKELIIGLLATLNKFLDQFLSHKF